MVLFALVVASLMLPVIRGDSLCISKNESVIITDGNTYGNCDGMVYMNTDKFHIGMNIDASLGINTLAPLPHDLGYILGITRVYNDTNEYGYYHEYSGDYIFENGNNAYQLTTIEAWQYSIEGWMMQWSDANATIQQRYNWYYNNFINDPNIKIAGVSTTKMSITSSANSESIIWLSTDEQLSIRTIVSIDHYTHYMKYTVSIKNIANETLRNVTYNRLFDPDLRKYRYYELHANTDDIMGVFETNNYVKYQANTVSSNESILNKFVRSTEPLESLVWATSQEMGKHIGIGAINSHSKVGFCPLVNVLTSYAEYITLCADTEWTSYGGTSIDNDDLDEMSYTDSYLYLNMLYPIMEPGEIYTFSYYYLLNITEEEVVVTDTTHLLIAQPTEILSGDGLVVVYSIDLLNSLELLVFGAANSWESLGTYTFESEAIQIISSFNSTKSYYCYNVYIDSSQYEDETNVHLKAVAYIGNERLTAHKSISIANTGSSLCQDTQLDFSDDSAIVGLGSCDTTADDATVISVVYYRELFIDGVEITSSYIGTSTSYPYQINLRINDLLPSMTSGNKYPIYIKAIITRKVNRKLYETAVVFSGYLNDDAALESSISVTIVPYLIAALSSAVVLVTIAYVCRLHYLKNAELKQPLPEDNPELKIDMFNYNSSFKHSSNHTSNTTSPASSPSNSIKYASSTTAKAASKQIDEDIYFEFDDVYRVNEHYV